MINPAYVQRMARYNRWQNENLYGAAEGLSPEEREKERGAFFGSIHKTLSHLLWADRVWMGRFTDEPSPPGGIPGSVTLYPDWRALSEERASFDQSIIAWADAVDEAWLAQDQTYYSGAAGRNLTRPRGRAACSSLICSITRPTIAGRSTACSRRRGQSRTTPICR
jgi:uncharacterized damage-inducible protein DinB